MFDLFTSHMTKSPSKLNTIRPEISFELSELIDLLLRKTVDERPLSARSVAERLVEIRGKPLRTAVSSTGASKTMAYQEIERTLEPKILPDPKPRSSESERRQDSSRVSKLTAETSHRFDEVSVEKIEISHPPKSKPLVVIGIFFALMLISLMA